MKTLLLIALAILCSSCAEQPRHVVLQFSGKLDQVYVLDELKTYAVTNWVPVSNMIGSGSKLHPDLIILNAEKKTNFYRIHPE